MNSITCGCGAAYQLTPQYYGAQFPCTACGRIVTVPVPSAPGQLDGLPRLAIKQKKLAINASYYIRDEAGRLVLFAFRPIQFLRQMAVLAVVFVGLLASLALAFIAADLLKSALGDGGIVVGMAVFAIGFVVSIVLAVFISPLRHITFYEDESRSRPVFEVLQLERFQFPFANYTVRGMDGTVLGHLRQHVLWGMIRRRWEMYAPGGALFGVAREDSPLMAIARRLFGPMYGLLRLNFIFVKGDGDDHHVFATFNREFTLFDSYVLDMTPDPYFACDRRLVVAQAILLDTGERR